MQNEVKYSNVSHRLSPYFYHFDNVEWAIFGTLTWNNEARRKPGAEWMRQDDFRQLICETSKRFRIRGRKLAYYRVLEYGGGECHYHFLIAREGIGTTEPVILAAYMQHAWEQRVRAFDGVSDGIGRADIRPYDQSQGVSAVRYCLKVESDIKGQLFERFDFPSPALCRLIHRPNSIVLT